VTKMISARAGSLMDGPSNLSTTERGAYMLAGLGLAAAAAKPRPNPLLNILALAGGSYLAWRGYVGQCPVKAALTGSSGSDRLAHHG
jgi:threonine/homoserine/homoserine lactone efflux protein